MGLYASARRLPHRASVYSLPSSTKNGEKRPQFSLFHTVTESDASGTGRRCSDRSVDTQHPPGSMTGAPKLAAISLLEDLEPVRRGVYSGAVGYFDQRGGMDLSVVIRTILLQKERACFQVGGAVVADSEAASEYAETIDKVRALWAAVNDVPVPKNDGQAR